MRPVLATPVLLLTISFCLDTCPYKVDSLSPSYVKYLGCFSTEFVDSHPYYKVRQPLPFEQGVHVCNHRLTVFAAVQENHRSPGEHTIFCGNELLNFSKKVDDDSCKPCSDKKQQHCGGPYSMSLYQLRDSTPLAVLIATHRSGVKLYTEGSILSTIRVPHDKEVDKLDFHYSEDEVYFFDNDNNILYRSVFKYTETRYGTPTIIKDWDRHRDNVDTVAVDWTSKNIYFTNFANKNMYRINVNGTNLEVVLDYSYNMYDLNIDPYKRTIYFDSYNVYSASEGKILFSYSMDSKRLTPLLISNVTWVHHISVDVQEQMIFIIGNVGDEPCLMKMDYDGAGVEYLYQGYALTVPLGLDVFKGEAVWINMEDLGEQYTVYMCKLTPKCSEPNALRTIEQTSEGINFVKIYHPERQTPSKNYLCDSLSCSHECEKLSLFVVRCTCPIDMVLGQDKKTCENILY